MVEVNDEYRKYYVTGTDNYTIYLVEEFSKLNSLEGCNISMDRYFTPVTLARWATEHKFSIVGTMRLDRKGTPKDFKSLYTGKMQGMKILCWYHILTKKSPD